ncbi:riboflavin kinase [Oceanobacillus sp. FSL K6-2867]|uniref:riboflavin kinase n=1 Tax=Oceanobacillus sp. FSL K6-2867 TaxID=2954748 RepID=UPI0030D8E478
MNNTDTMLTCVYQTKGMITRENIRTTFLDYQIADITIHPDIPLPAEGNHPISIKIEGTWYKAIASVASKLTNEHNKAVKAYIYKLNRQLNACSVLISWDKYLNTSKKQMQSESFPAAANL